MPSSGCGSRDRLRGTRGAFDRKGQGRRADRAGLGHRRHQEHDRKLGITTPGRDCGHRVAIVTGLPHRGDALWRGCSIAARAGRARSPASYTLTEWIRAARLLGGRRRSRYRQVHNVHESQEDQRSAVGAARTASKRPCLACARSGRVFRHTRRDSSAAIMPPPSTRAAWARKDRFHEACPQTAGGVADCQMSHEAPRQRH